MRAPIRSLVAAATLMMLAAHAEVATGVRGGTTCIEDDPVPTPPAYAGWERSSVVAWQAIEDHGGIVPDIEEDRSHAPPAWWRYPSPLRSAELLAGEAKNPKGLYSAVASADLKAGDLLVRARGAGACGKMAVVGGLSEKEQWVTIEPEGDGEGQGTKEGNPVFFDGKALRPEVTAYRMEVKKDSTLGHVRELDRDLSHLERTIAERPPLVVRKGRGVVEEKIHDLIDEAASLSADAAFDNQRRALTGRALALAAALDWPGAAEEAAAVLDDAVTRPASRSDALPARTALYLLAGDAAKAAELGESGAALPGISPRLNYLVGRALLAAGKPAPGLAALKRYLDDDPADPRARRLIETAGREPALAPPPTTGADLTFSATPERATLHSRSYGFDVSWPISWRVVSQTTSPELGVVIELSTGRVLRDDGEAERAGASLLVQRPGSAGAATALARSGARNIFPDAKLKTLPPLVPGSKREQFRERAQGSQHQGEVSTVERNGTVFFLVLNASPASYPKLKAEYAAFVKSLGPAPQKPPPAPKN